MVIAAARDAVTLAELADVVFYQVSAQRKEVADEAVAQLESESEETADFPMQILVRHDETHLEVRVRGVSDRVDATYVLDVGARFTFAQPVEFEPPALQEFVERVGVMAVYPYIREGLHDLAAKLRLPAPLLKLIRGGQVQLQPSEEALADQSEG